MKNYSGMNLIIRLIKSAFPRVNTELDNWMNLSGRASDALLKDQALSSLKHKKFHVQGGSVYALYPGVDLDRTIKFIVSFQTISDYLDNLCDRAGVKDEKSFRQLHLALLDSINPSGEKSDYYLYYPYKKDNNYLDALVDECRRQISGLPSYSAVVERMKYYIGLYSDLQTLKHLDENTRMDSLIKWCSMHLKNYPDLSWWEFSAATGSTLGIFMLFAAAFNPSLDTKEVSIIHEAYFPWICGVHILLDYYIDAMEDREMGDLNFTSFYATQKHCEERLSFFITQAFEYSSNLKYQEYHATIIKGLLAMYLSDPKAMTGINKMTSYNLIEKGGSKTLLYHFICKLLRSARKL